MNEFSLIIGATMVALLLFVVFIVGLGFYTYLLFKAAKAENELLKRQLGLRLDGKVFETKEEKDGN